jgi:general secretion pathway protein N
MNAADRRRLTPMLGAVAVLLALLLVALWLGLGRGAHWSNADAAPKLPALANATPPPVVPPLEHFDAVWQHPLFSPDRAPEAASGDGGGSSGNLELTGVIMQPGLNMAILHDKTSGKDFRVVEGRATHAGPTLVALHPRSAVVEAAGSRLQLKLTPGPAPDSANPDVGNQDAGDGYSSAGQALPVVHQADAAHSAAARAQELRERIEARRRRNSQNGGH